MQICARKGTRTLLLLCVKTCDVRFIHLLAEKFPKNVLIRIPVQDRDFVMPDLKKNSEWWNWRYSGQ